MTATLLRLTPTRSRPPRPVSSSTAHLSPAAGRRVLGVEDPATGRTLAGVADAAPLDCMAALEAAVAAQGSWAATAPRDRVPRPAPRIRWAPRGG